VGISTLGKLTEEEPFRDIKTRRFKFACHLCGIRSDHNIKTGVVWPSALMYLFKNYAVKNRTVFTEV